MSEPDSVDDDVRIEVTATMHGHPSSVLRAMRSIRSNTKRTVQIHLDLRKRGGRYYETHLLPAITNGDTADAHEHLRMLYRQGFMSTTAEQGIALMIENFGKLTE